MSHSIKDYVNLTLTAYLDRPQDTRDNLNTNVGLRLHRFQWSET